MIWGTIATDYMNRVRHRLGLITAVCLLARGGFAYGDTAFDREIQPILAEYCFACHGPDAEQRKAGLRLDTRTGLFGESGTDGPVVPGQPAESELLQRIRAADPEDRMPPPEAKIPLSPEQIQRLEQWIEEGAAWEGHWAFEPIRKPALPTPASSEWVRTPPDAFVLARLDEEDLEPAPPASRTQWIRRVTLDLHGLPPTLAEVDHFLEDESADAFERVVDRLLASPRYGERMVWDWLDAARYADSNGYQADRERTMWPWRDWATSAINANLPFDVFTRFQLAGDLLTDPTPEAVLATGFNRNHMINGEGGRIPEENRVDYVMDMAETTGTVWLGLTMNCCRCHDHKFDSISQQDYYRLFAFFNQTPVNGGGGDPQTAPVIAWPSETQERRRSDLRDRAARQGQTVDDLEATFRSAADTDLATALADALDQARRERKPEHWDTLVAEIGPEHSGYEAAVKTWRKTRDGLNQVEKAIPKVMVMRDREETRETFILNRGLYNKRGETVSAQTPAALPAMSESEPRNRLGLANWILDPENPLTARVVVNRHWAVFFGRGLVATPEDFGTQGERPSHPELLDWLAADFVASGWDVKRLHRLLVLSATYQQASVITPEKQERDPENRWLSRGVRHRLPSWMIRDQALAASGLLVGTIGGPPVKPYQPDGVWADFTFGKKHYAADSGAALYRRSVYTFWRRIIGPTMFFDAAKRQTCVVRSSRTNTPLHALATLNDVTYVEAARALAERVMTSAETPEARLALAFRLVTARQPGLEERDILVNRLAAAKRSFDEDPQAAKALLAEGASQRSEEFDPAEHAAYTAVCTLILNLDEALNKP